jgi:hypothetical protein
MSKKKQGSNKGSNKGPVMRIAMPSRESLHSIAVGGVADHVAELAAALARKGHQIHVFTHRLCGQAGYDWMDESFVLSIGKVNS